jgi:hypothetical protein
MPTAPKSEKTYKLIEEGTYMARVYSVVCLGLHDIEWQGQKKTQSKVRVTWELPTELIEYEKDGKKVSAPSVVGKEYTFSMGEKANLRKVVEQVIGTSLRDDEAEGFDIFNLLGMPCMLSIAHKPKKDGSGKYAIINSIATPMKGMTVPPQVNPTVKFDIAEWDEKVFATLPPFIKDRIMESYEKRKIDRPAPKEDLATIEYPEQDINPEDIPF